VLVWPMATVRKVSRLPIQIGRHWLQICRQCSRKVSVSIIFMIVKGHLPFGGLLPRPPPEGFPVVLGPLGGR